MTDSWKPILKIDDLPTWPGSYLVTLVDYAFHDYEPCQPMTILADFDSQQKIWLIGSMAINALLPAIGEVNGVKHVSHWQDMPEPAQY